MNTWDKLEAAGHDLTHLDYRLGRSFYICENCGSFVVIKLHEIAIFHSPPTVEASATQCVPVDPSNNRGKLKKLLEALDKQDLEKLQR